jgi:hypothetical protein
MMGSGKDKNVAEPSALGTSDYGGAEAKRLGTANSGGFDWDTLFSGLMNIKPTSPGSGTPSTGAMPEGASVPAASGTLPAMKPAFLLSPRQESMLGARFGTNTEAKRQYVIQRILSGDRSLAPYTPEQMHAARTQSAQLAPAQQPSAFDALVRSVGAH